MRFHDVWELAPHADQSALSQGHSKSWGALISIGSASKKEIPHVQKKAPAHEAATVFPYSSFLQRLAGPRARPF